MKADKREIVTFVIAALATLVAVWFFLGKMQKEKDTVRTDLYTLVAPASDAILSVNRPAAFTKYILSRKPFFRLLSTRGHTGGKLQQETTRRSRPNPTKPAKLPATRPRPPAQVIRQKRPFEPDGTIGQSRPLCFPPRFNRMGYPKRLVRRRSFHE